MKLYVTYGCGTDKNRGYSVVEGEDIIDCMKQVSEACGPRYAFTYREDEFAGQVERWGLRELPLGPHTVTTTEYEE